MSEKKINNANIRNKEVQVVVNRPDPSVTLFPNHFCENVMEKILIDNNMLKSFSESCDVYTKIKESSDNKLYSSREFFRQSIKILPLFVEEYKRSSDVIKKQVLSLLSERVVAPVGQFWFNFSDESETKFEINPISVNEKDKIISENKSIKKDLNVVSVNEEPKKILFMNFQGPGDIVMLTAAIRDLHLNHPGRFITDVKTSSQHIWEGNPYVEWAKGTPLDEKDPNVTSFRLGYPLIHQSNQGPYHFSEAFTEEIEELLGVRIKKRICKGDIHIRPEEDIWAFTERATWFTPYGFGPNDDYWIIDCGHKQDFTAKFWGKEKFQKVVDHFKGKIKFVQIGHKAHIHFALDGAIDLIGKTDDRQCIRLVWASSGVLTPVSWPMTLAAAIPVKSGKCNNRQERPCVIVGGGREPSRWQSYCNHQYIHTNGCLPCCDRGGCWASRTKPIGDGDEKDVRNLCSNVTIDDYGEEVPYCMSMISVEDVVRRIEMYYEFYNDSRKKYTYNKG
jgi:hypothetical protein